MAVRDLFRINWRRFYIDWKFWLWLLGLDLAYALFDEEYNSIICIIFYLILEGLGLGFGTVIGFVPTFLWVILAVFLVIKFRGFFGRVASGTGDFFSKGIIRRFLIGWPLRLIGRILGYKAGQTKWKALRRKYRGIRGAYIGNLWRQAAKNALVKMPW